MLRHLKEHSAVVVKKEFQLRKAFNFCTKYNTSMKAVYCLHCYMFLSDGLLFT